MINGKYAARVAGATVAIAFGMLSTGAADADTFVPLPGGEIVKTLSDGTVVTVRLVGESATISPSMGSTPSHRNAWASGSAQVQIGGANSAVGGSIFPGYTVGCQINIAGGGVDGGVEGTADWSGEQVTGGVGASGEAVSPLGPGQARSFYLLDREKAYDFGAESHKTYNSFSGSSGSVTWADSTIGLIGCAGYAQARAFVKS